jgi:hypothetical protein
MKGLFKKSWEFLKWLWSVDGMYACNPNLMNIKAAVDTIKKINKEVYQRKEKLDGNINGTSKRM